MRAARSTVFSRREALTALLAGCSLPALLRAAEVPWLDEVQRPGKPSTDAAPKLSPLMVDEHGGKITSLEQWQGQRKAIRDWWQKFLGTWDDSPRVVPSLTVVKEDRVDGVVRQLVRYEAEPGDVTEAYILKPAAPAGRRPGVVVFHSTVPNSILQPAGVGMAADAPKVFGLGLRGAATWPSVRATICGWKTPSSTPLKPCRVSTPGIPSRRAWPKCSTTASWL